MGFTDRLANAWKIFTTSFAFIGRDKSLVVVPMLMLISAIFFCTIIILIHLASPEKIGGWLIIFAFIASVWSTFLGAMQSWMVHEVAQGKDTTVASGLKRALHNWKDIIAYTIVFMIIASIINSIRKRGIIGRHAAGAMDIFSNIIGKLLIPAMIVTEKTFGQAIKDLHKNVHAIPEIATYEIGIRPLNSIIIVLGIGITWVLATTIGGLIAILFAVVYLLLFILLTLFINNTYYTLLYLTLIEKKHVKGLKLR